MTKRLVAIGACLTLLAAGSALAGLPEVKTYMQGGKWPQAIKELQTLIETSGEWPDGHRLLGDCYLRTGQADNAISEYEKAIELNGDRFDYRRNLSQAYFALKKDYTRTIEVLNEAEPTAVSPEQKAYVNKYRGLSYAYSKNPSAAVANLKNANPAGDKLVSKWLGTSCFEVGDYACAIENLDRAVKNYPKDYDLAYYLARAHLISGLRGKTDGQKKAHYNSAVAAARKAIALDNTTKAQATLAKAQLGAGQFGEAERVFRSLIQKEPRECTHYLDLITTLREEEKWDDVIEIGGSVTGESAGCENKQKASGWTQVGFAWLKKDDKSLSDERRTSLLTKSIDASKKAKSMGADGFAQTNLQTAQENLQRHKDTMASIAEVDAQKQEQLKACEESLDFQRKTAAYLKETDQPDADGDGIADTIDACPDTPERTLVDKKGCETAQLKVCNDLLHGK